MSNTNNSPGQEYDEIIISSDDYNSEEDEDDSDYIDNSSGKQQQEQAIQYQQSDSQHYELASPQQLEYQFQNMNAKQGQSDPRMNQADENNIPQKIEMENIKMRLSQYDIRDGNSTPNSPSYLLFAPEQIKLNSDKNYAQEKIEKQLLKTLEEFSPISRMEDSRGDMTVQMFDLSMMQSRDLHYNQNLHIQGGQSATRLIKSTFSTQVNTLQNKEISQKNPTPIPSVNQLPSNAPQPPSMTRLTTNSKQEQKTQKLRERLEKYSHQMMNNINLQKVNSDAGQQKSQTKSVQVTSTKNLPGNSVESKRVQAIKGSAKNSKVSTPVTSKNTLNDHKQGDSQNEQRREKSQNAYQKPTLSSSRKIEQQSKTERNTPSNSSQNQNIIGNQNVAKTKKQNLQQSLQQQQQIQIQLQKKISSAIPNEKSSKQPNIVQAKFLLTSPQRNKHQVNNATPGSIPSQRLPQQAKINQQEIKLQRHSDIVGDYEFQGRTNNQKTSPSPKNRVNTASVSSNGNSNANNHMSAGNNLRKYSDNMNDRSVKKSYSQENINFTRTDSFSSQQSANKQSMPNRIHPGQESNDEQKIDQIQDLITIRQQYKESFDNYFMRKSQERKQSEEMRYEEINNDDEQRDEDGDVFAINIYKNQLTQQKSGSTQKVEEDDDDDINDMPQLYHINRSQSQHQQNVNQPESVNEDDGKNNSQNFMRRSYTQDNMLQHVKQQQNQQSERNQQYARKNSHNSQSNQMDDSEQMLYQSANNKDMIFSSPSKDNILFSKEQITDNSFTQNGNNFYNNYNLGNYQISHSNPKTSPYNFNTQNQQQTIDSNFTAYTNAISQTTTQGNQISSYQSYKAVSSAKYIDQDEDEVLNSQEQYICSKENEVQNNKNKEEFQNHNQQLKNDDLKTYNIQSKSRKSDLVQHSKGSPNREAYKTSPRMHTQSSVNNNNNYINLGKNTNYYNSTGNDKPVSQRYSEQTDVRKKTDPGNKSYANNSNTSLNLNNPICLYNLHKDGNNKNNKSNNNPTYQQNSNYYSLKEATTQSSSRKINVNNQQKEQQSPPMQDSPIKLSGNNQNLNDLKLQAQQLQQQIIDISQKSKRGVNAQSIHIIEKPNHNSYSQQPQRSYPNLPSDSQLYSSNQPSTTTAQSSQQYSSSHPHTFHSVQTAQTNPATPQNNNASQQAYTQHSQYAQQFQQKQAGRIVSQREVIKKKEKFIRNSNDFKIQQEQDIIDKALQRKGSSGNFRGSYKDPEDQFKRKLTLAKSFQGDNSANKNNALLSNVSYNENYNSSHPGDLKTLQTFYKSGSDLNSNANKKIISQFNTQSQSKTERQENQQSYAQLSHSIQANRSQQGSYQNARKNSNKASPTTVEQNMIKQSSKGVESQRSAQKTPKQQNHQTSYAEDSAFTEVFSNLQQQQQQKQAIQIQKMLGKCFNNSTTNETEYYTKGKNSNKGKDQQKANQKATSTSTYDTNIDYILKHLKEAGNKQQQPQSSQGAKNTNASFNLNNKSITLTQQPQKSQQKQPTTQSISPPTNQYPTKESFSNYHKLIQEKLQKSPSQKQGQSHLPSQKERDQISQRIQQIEQEIPKIQQQKNLYAQENLALEQYNQSLKAQIENV